MDVELCRFHGCFSESAEHFLLPGFLSFGSYLSIHRELVIRFFDYLIKLKKKKLNDTAHLICPDLVIDTSVLIHILALKISGLKMEGVYVIFFPESSLHSAAV